MSQEASFYDIDNLDRAILAYLVHDAKTPYTAIAKKLIVSPGTIHIRVKKMEKTGLIKGSHLEIDPTLLGYDLSAFLGIHLEKGSVYRKVIDALEKIPEIVSAHYTTGTYGIFVQVVCKNTKHLREILNEKIQAIEGVSRTETFISLEESIHRRIIPPPED